MDSTFIHKIHIAKHFHTPLLIHSRSVVIIDTNSTIPPISISFADIDPYPGIDSLPHKVVITAIMDEPSNIDDLVDEPNVDLVHVF